MTIQHAAPAARPRTTTMLLWAAPLYWLRIFPAARREVRAWHGRAQAIPDPVLRQHALTKLDEEGFSAEGAAAFGILASRRRRRKVIRACVAFEVLYDYLDALTEDCPTLANNRQLHQALSSAIDLDRLAAVDFYAHHGQRDDGGYLRQLVAACRGELRELPRRDVVGAALVGITERAAEAQSLNHAGAVDGHEALVRWAEQQAARHAGVHWFELAAGAGSPLGVFALAAAASHDNTSESQAHAIADAYFPWLAALHWLLESLVDRADDEVTGNHSYVGHYRSPTDAAARLALIAERAVADVSRLPTASRHLLLLAGMAGLSLTHEGAENHVNGAAHAVRDAIGPSLSPFLVMLRVRRWAKRMRSTAARGTQRHDGGSRGGDVGVQAAGADREGAVDA